MRRDRLATHWFRLAHDALPPGGRAGLVGTNTIRQNESREASLDDIVENGGVITDTISTPGLERRRGSACLHRQLAKNCPTICHRLRSPLRRLLWTLQWLLPPLPAALRTPVSLFLHPCQRLLHPLSSAFRPPVIGFLTPCHRLLDPCHRLLTPCQSMTAPRKMRKLPEKTLTDPKKVILLCK